MATSPKEQANEAKVRSQELMDTNNAAASDTSDKLLSILEGGKGSSITRDLLDQYLHNYVTTRIRKDRLNSLNYDRAQLRKFLSIKEKIAYATGLMYASDGLNKTPKIRTTSTRDIEDDRLRITLDQIIKNIEKDLIENRDFTESRILRNAAINRFECKISDVETIKLNTFGAKVRAACKANGLETLEESTHFTHESDAQKILKLSDILLQMSAMGANLDPKVLKEFEPFNEKVKPLKDLDNHYKHVTKTLNMLHRVAQKGYHAMIRRPQKEKLDEVLQKLDMMKTVNQELNNFNKIENFDNNDEHGFLDNLLNQIQQNPNFKKTIYAMSISEAQFNERFMSSCAFTLVNAAKFGLHKQKGNVFGDRLAKFEEDTQSRRGIVRRRIFSIADNMGTSGDFASEQDFTTANSYFDKFRDLFFAKEEDNYLNGAPNAKTPSDLHYHKMEKVISALIRRRVPALGSSHRIRRGSAGRILYKFIEHALKGIDRGVFQWIRRMWHNADDATIVAMVIMIQNESTNQVFYQDQDRTKKADSRWGKLWNRISFAENGRKAIRDRISPTVNKTLALTEETVKKGLQLSKGVAKVGNKVVSKTARATTWTLGAGTGKFNAMMQKGGYKRWKTPLYLPYILTAPTERVMKYGYKGATYTDRMGNQHIDELGNTVNKGYTEAKDLVSKATGEETKYLFQGLTYATEQATSLVGQTVGGAGQRMYDGYTVGQQRGILGAFYRAAKEEKFLDNLMQSSELGDMLNLKHRGPRLFDEDGRIVSTDRIEVKEKDSPAEAGKELAVRLNAQLAKLGGQIDNEISKAQKEAEKAIKENKENEKIQANIEVENKRTLKRNINTINIGISSLLPILKDVMGGGTWRHADIQGRIGIVVGGAFAPGTIRHTLTNLINGINIPASQIRVNDKFRDLNVAKGTVKATEARLQGLNRGLDAKNITQANRRALLLEIGHAEADLIAAQEAESRAMIGYNEALVNLKNEQQRISVFETIDQTMERIGALSKDMFDAADDTARKAVAKEIFELAKNINWLLYPEEEKKDDKAEKIKEILAKDDIDSTAKNDLIKNLLAA